ncbi:hypothetical protein, partial [Flavisolibacter nicotianae]|uniref:hypothetical protein n=1 Tax=Flavisolibacter nicotianae TaxID=2364882 RepID=UPI0019692944
VTGYFMRQLLLIISLKFISLTTLAQTDRVERLVDSINDNQVGIAMQYVWYPKMKSPWGDTLIAIGKPATTQLFNVLNDTTKGIIAHFILSNIWANELSKAGHRIGSRVSPVEGLENISLQVLYSGFTFYADEQNHLFAKRMDLESNKKNWQTFLDKQSSR